MVCGAILTLAFINTRVKEGKREGWACVCVCVLLLVGNGGS